MDATSTSAQALLNSLQTQISNQLTQLPTLHAQLGLPSSALSDELEALRRALVATVEGQVDRRRVEVDEWMGRCDAVDKECGKLGRALGSYAKSAVGVTTGELKKVQVLPKRHEQLQAHQEKLYHLYQTRLEQLHALTARIGTLSHTLGPSFYARDVLEPTPATDDPDPSAWRDVTPERFSRLEKELVRGKTEISRRLAHLANTLEHVTWLHTELGIALPCLDDDPLSLAVFSPELGLAVRPFPLPKSHSISSLAQGPDPFAAPPTEDARHCGRIFAQYVARLEEAENESLAMDADTLGVEGVEPTLGLVAWAERVKYDLEELKTRRETAIQAMYDELEVLWKRLGVDEGSIDEFVELHRGSTGETLRAYEDELARMLELKRARMGHFVENAREEIRALWDDLMFGDDERGEFCGMLDEEHTEELLMLHEEEIARLKDERRTKAPLLAAVRRWMAICGEERELAAASADQSRLMGRGVRGDPGRLLREEKMRKRVQKEKPRLEQELRNAIPEWERTHDRPFVVLGQRALEMVDEASGGEKENKKRPKPNVVPARATTPTAQTQNINGKRVTPSSRTASQASATAAPPTKRAKITPQARPPLSSHNRTASAHPHPPSKSASKSKGGVYSHLPRPTSNHASLGIGHPTSNAKAQRERIPSNVSTGSTRGLYARLSDRARRESFRPRASVDGWAESVGILGRNGAGWTGWVGIEEEDES
ncbi:hypothetical protein EXIGLDRAFT_603456 [Exidia glandulosa HHB12029]|uniref:Microtubule associated protein n=1 Tax=Exidia glandulosa HHB12029 TaxID=1314781 RepID=A0A165NRQ2_EXIGL|nr:hypothetical protein EXIGLDRAFT_603456 [Exidia glandulosa HHB12029]